MTVNTHWILQYTPVYSSILQYTLVYSISGLSSILQYTLVCLHQSCISYEILRGLAHYHSLVVGMTRPAVMVCD